MLYVQNGLATKVEKSRKQMKERKNRARKIRGVKKVGLVKRFVFLLIQTPKLFILCSCLTFCRLRLEMLLRRNELRFLRYRIDQSLRRFFMLSVFYVLNFFIAWLDDGFFLNKENVSTFSQIHMIFMHKLFIIFIINKRKLYILLIIHVQLISCQLSHIAK